VEGVWTIPVDMRGAVYTLKYVINFKCDYNSLYHYALLYINDYHPVQEMAPQDRTQFLILIQNRCY